MLDSAGLLAAKGGLLDAAVAACCWVPAPDNAPFRARFGTDVGVDRLLACRRAAFSASWGHIAGAADFGKDGARDAVRVVVDRWSAPTAPARGAEVAEALADGARVGRDERVWHLVAQTVASWADHGLVFGAGEAIGALATLARAVTASLVWTASPDTQPRFAVLAAAGGWPRNYVVSDAHPTVLAAPVSPPGAQRVPSTTQVQVDRSGTDGAALDGVRLVSPHGPFAPATLDLSGMALGDTLTALDRAWAATNLLGAVAAMASGPEWHTSPA
jgi:hypothetical protein